MKPVHMALSVTAMLVLVVTRAQSEPKDGKKVRDTITRKDIVKDREIIKDRAVLKAANRLRITYPKNGIWVLRGTGVVLNGTAKNKSYLVVDALYEGTHNTYQRMPYNRWHKSSSAPFSDKKMFSYDFFGPDDGKDGKYTWSFNRIRTESTEQKIGEVREEWIPNRVHITVYKANAAPPKASGPEEKTQTISVEIRDPQ